MILHGLMSHFFYPLFHYREKKKMMKKEERLKRAGKCHLLMARNSVDSFFMKMKDGRFFAFL